MLFFTHLQLAKILNHQDFNKIQSEYWVGAVLPDIRYVSAIPRSVTHAPFENIKDLAAEREIYKGYLAHLLIDRYTVESGFYKRIRAKAPRRLRWVFSGMLINVLLEIKYLSKYEMSADKYRISAQYDSKLINFGIDEEAFNGFVGIIKKLVANPELESVLNIIKRNPNLSNNLKVRRYFGLATFFLKRRWLVEYLLKVINPEVDLFEKGLNNIVIEISK